MGCCCWPQAWNISRQAALQGTLQLGAAAAEWLVVCAEAQQVQVLASLQLLDRLKQMASAESTEDFALCYVSLLQVCPAGGLALHALLQLPGEKGACSAVLKQCLPQIAPGVTPTLLERLVYGREDMKSFRSEVPACLLASEHLSTAWCCPSAAAHPAGNLEQRLHTPAVDSRQLRADPGVLQGGLHQAAGLHGGGGRPCGAGPIGEGPRHSGG